LARELTLFKKRKVRGETELGVGGVLQECGVELGELERGEVEDAAGGEGQVAPFEHGAETEHGRLRVVALGAEAQLHVLREVEAAQAQPDVGHVQVVLHGEEAVHALVPAQVHVLLHVPLPVHPVQP